MLPCFVKARIISTHQLLPINDSNIPSVVFLAIDRLVRQAFSLGQNQGTRAKLEAGIVVDDGREEQPDRFAVVSLSLSSSTHPTTTLTTNDNVQGFFFSFFFPLLDTQTKLNILLSA